MREPNSTLQAEFKELDAVMANLKQCSQHHLYLFHQASSQVMRYREALMKIQGLGGVVGEMAWEALEKK